MDMNDLDMEIGFPVALPAAGRDHIQSSAIPGGTVATCLYVGPYAECEKGYTELMGWVAAQGREMTGIGYEHYLNDPAETRPEDLQTLIVFPLK
jgi:effector-binding domain-containing protein